MLGYWGSKEINIQLVKVSQIINTAAQQINLTKSQSIKAPFYISITFQVESLAVKSDVN